MLPLSNHLFSHWSIPLNYLFRTPVQERLPDSRQRIQPSRENIQLVRSWNFFSFHEILWPLYRRHNLACCCRQKPGVKIEQCLDYSQDPDHPMNEVNECGEGYTGSTVIYLLIFSVHIVDPVYSRQHFLGAVPYWCNGSFSKFLFYGQKDFGSGSCLLSQ